MSQQDKLALARNIVFETLKKNTKWKPEKLSQISDDIVKSISHLIALNESSGRKLGATVMTESAAIDSRRIKPRII